MSLIYKLESVDFGSEVGKALHDFIVLSLTINNPDYNGVFNIQIGDNINVLKSKIQGYSNDSNKVDLSKDSKSLHFFNSNLIGGFLDPKTHDSLGIYCILSYKNNKVFSIDIISETSFGSKTVAKVPKFYDKVLIQLNSLQ